MKRRLFTLTLLAAALLPAAETRVFVTEHGKTYHQTKTCMALSRALPEHVHEVTEKSATEHELRRCGICWRAKKAPKADGSAWMKDGKK